MTGHQLGREGAQLGDDPFHLPYLHQISRPQGPRVDQHQATHGMVHDPGRAQGHHQTEEDAHPLEGVRIRPRQIGIGDGQGKQPDHHGE